MVIITASTAVWHWECDTGSVTLGVWHWECDTGSVTLRVWHWECYTGSVTLGVWHWESELFRKTPFTHLRLTRLISFIGRVLLRHRLGQQLTVSFGPGAGLSLLLHASLEGVWEYAHGLLDSNVVGARRVGPWLGDLVRNIHRKQQFQSQNRVGNYP